MIFTKINYPIARKIIKDIENEYNTNGEVEEVIAKKYSEKEYKLIRGRKTFGSETIFQAFLIYITELYGKCKCSTERINQVMNLVGTCFGFGSKAFEKINDYNEYLNSNTQLYRYNYFWEEDEPNNDLNLGNSDTITKYSYILLKDMDYYYLIDVD